MECFKCGVSGSKARLLDVISREGIVKVCEKCFPDEDMPVVRKPTTFQLRESGIVPKSAQKTVYERLSSISAIQNRGIAKSELLARQETTLKDIVNRNFEKNLDKGQGGDLIDKFHWIIMRARRLKHLTQSQFAEAIAEPEAAIMEAERGLLPKNSYGLIKKIENYLGIKLMKKQPVEQKKEPVREIRFDLETTKSLTISDLKEMKRKKEEEIFSNPFENQSGENQD